MQILLFALLLCIGPIPLKLSAQTLSGDTLVNDCNQKKSGTKAPKRSMIRDHKLQLETLPYELTPHYLYSSLHGFDSTAYVLSGLSLNLVYDSRDNQINAYEGPYGPWGGPAGKVRTGLHCRKIEGRRFDLRRNGIPFPHYPMQQDTGRSYLFECNNSLEPICRCFAVSVCQAGNGLRPAPDAK